MQDEFEHQSPVNPLPPVVVALFLLIVGIELVLTLGGRGVIGGPDAIGWRLTAINKYGYSGEIFHWMLNRGQWPLEHVIRFVTYLFVHGGMTHAIFAGAMVLALGKMVGEVFHPVATLLVFLGSGAAGALAFSVILSGPGWLLGAFPGVYGLIGAFTYLLWTRLGELGAPQIRAFTMIGVLLVIQLVFALLFGGNGDWVADVAGFAAGFLMSFFLAPGGWSRLRGKIRHD